jgi:prevent-host-death family protein
MDLLTRLGLIKRVRPARPAQFNVYDARANFSRLVERAEHGETIVVARNGRPVARLVPFGSPVPTKPGVIRTTMVIHPPSPPVPGVTEPYERNGRR